MVEGQVEVNGPSPFSLPHPLHIMSDKHKIIGLAGNTLGVVKRAHDPEKVDRARKDMSARLNEHLEGFAADMATDPLGATKPDEAAVFTHWDDLWRDLCKRRGDSDMPVLYEADAFKVQVDLWHKGFDLKRKYNAPLKEVNDLSPWEFRLVGNCELGTVWLNSAIALCIDLTGQVFVIIRPKYQSLVAWAEQAWLDAALWEAGFEVPEMTLGAVFELLTLLHYPKMLALPEALMQIARAGDPKDAMATAE